MTYSFKFILAVSALGTGILAMPAAPAQAQDAEAAIKARKAHMQLNSFNLGPLGAMAKGDMPYDATVASAAANNLAAIAALDQTRIWAKGSGRPDAENTRALAVIWETPDDFAAKIDGLRDATQKMVAAAGTDLDALRAAMGGVGKACGACHETYRAER